MININWKDVLERPNFTYRGTINNIFIDMDINVESISIRIFSRHRKTLIELTCDKLEFMKNPVYKLQDLIHLYYKNFNIK